jgi:hypothetical protein
MEVVSAQRLAEMIEQATVDCYDEAEQVSGLFTMIEDNLAVPFGTHVLGVQVTVEAVELTRDGQIVAVCCRGERRQRVPVLDLPLPDRAPVGTERIQAYRAWSTATGPEP